MQKTKKPQGRRLGRRRVAMARKITRRCRPMSTHRDDGFTKRTARSKPSPDLLERVDFLACLFAK